MRDCGRRGLMGGVVLLSIGTVFLLRNLGFIGENVFEMWWPLLLIGIGVARLAAVRAIDRPKKPYSDFGSA